MARILIIDDHEEFRRMMERTLIQAGYEAVTAANGRKALAIYNQDTIDLVITDVFMPDMEGTETVIRMKEINPKIKIIAISGGGSRTNFDYLDTMKEFGALRTFEKPFDSKDLLGAIRELLESE